jgi:hypothetical protein
MGDRFPAAFVIGIAVVAVAVGGILFMQRGARVGLTGNVLKVRTAPMDDNSSVAVLDFRFNNPSDVYFVVRLVTVVLEDRNGGRTEGQTISEVDAKRMFELLPLLGQKFNETLIMGEKIPSKSAQDRMVSARFELPEERLTSRRRFMVKIEEIDGAISELSEK